jgi:predicted ATPase
LFINYDTLKIVEASPLFLYEVKIMTLFLKSARIINFKSLADVTLNFRDLTILVGANSSGKSNCLESLNFLSAIVLNSSPPSSKLINRFLRKNATDNIKFKVMVENLYGHNINKSEYKLYLGSNPEESIFSEEELKVNTITVIQVKNGQGKVCDEDGNNSQDYKSKIGNLALKSAGDFGNKPMTSKIAEFIREWQIYDLDPDLMRGRYFNFLDIDTKKEAGELKIPVLDTRGSELEDILIKSGSKS